MSLCNSFNLRHTPAKNVCPDENWCWFSLDYGLENVFWGETWCYFKCYGLLAQYLICIQYSLDLNLDLGAKAFSTEKEEGRGRWLGKSKVPPGSSLMLHSSQKRN